jgi:hypothetical protein
VKNEKISQIPQNFVYILGFSVYNDSVMKNYHNTDCLLPIIALVGLFFFACVYMASFFIGFAIGEFIVSLF